MQYQGVPSALAAMTKSHAFSRRNWPREYRPTESHRVSPITTMMWKGLGRSTIESSARIRTSVGDFSRNWSKFPLSTCFHGWSGLPSYQDQQVGARPMQIPQELCPRKLSRTKALRPIG